jgi:hypothetical protein
MDMKLASFGVHSVVGEAWRVLKTQPGYIALFLLGIVLIKIGGGLVSFALEWLDLKVLISIWDIITSLIDMYVGILTITVSLKLIRGVKMTLAETWVTDKQVMLQYLIVTIVYGLMVAVGYVLLIVPGIIIQLTYSLATFLVIDKGMRMREALAESHRLTSGNRWKILEIGLVLGLINIAGLLAIGLGLLITIPLSMIATAVIYTQLAQEKTKEPMQKYIRPEETVKPEPVIPPAQPIMPVQSTPHLSFEKKPETSSTDVNQYQI